MSAAEARALHFVFGASVKSIVVSHMREIVNGLTVEHVKRTDVASCLLQ